MNNKFLKFISKIEFLFNIRVTDFNLCHLVITLWINICSKKVENEFTVSSLTLYSLRTLIDYSHLFLMITISVNIITSTQSMHIHHIKCTFLNRIAIKFWQCRIYHRHTWLYQKGWCFPSWHQCLIFDYIFHRFFAFSLQFKNSFQKVPWSFCILLFLIKEWRRFREYHV